MAKYKTLENGSYGYKYRNHYIIKDDPSKKISRYTVLDKDYKTVKEGFPDFHEAEWSIDLSDTDDNEREFIRKLALMDVFELNGEVIRISVEYPNGKIPKNIREQLKLIIKVRDRKTENKSLKV